MRDSAEQHQFCVARKVGEGYFCKTQLRLCHLRGLTPMRMKRLIIRLKMLLLTAGAGEILSENFRHLRYSGGKCGSGKLP